MQVLHRGWAARAPEDERSILVHHGASTSLTPITLGPLPLLGYAAGELVVARPTCPSQPAYMTRLARQLDPFADRLARGTALAHPELVTEASLG